MLQAPHAKVVWNAGKKRWEVRIEVGSEVVKRPIPKEAGDSADALRSQALQIAKDEGYELDPSNVAVEQAPSRVA